MACLFLSRVLYYNNNMRNEIKIIFVDIDWTLLDHNKHDFDYESIDGLKKAQKKGVLVYLCTARPYESIMQIHLLDHFKPDGIICTNGGLVFYNDKVIMKNLFPSDMVKETLKVCNKKKLEVEYGTIKDRYFSVPSNKYVTNYFSTFNEKACPVKDYEGEEVTSLLLMCPKRFDRYLKKRLPKELDYFRFHPFGVDIRYVRNDKGLGIDFVLKYHNICYDNALSIGDDLQDIFMFEKTKYSACLENGKDETKKAAKYICKSIDQHGVLDTLKYFKII